VTRLWFVPAEMAIDLYYLPIGAPSRSVLMTAKILGIDLNLKLVDTYNKEQLKPEFLKVRKRYAYLSEKQKIWMNAFTLLHSGPVLPPQ